MEVFWSVEDLKEFLSTLAEPVSTARGVPQRPGRLSLIERNSAWAEYIVSFCDAFASGNCELAETIKAEGLESESNGYEHCFQKCVLLFGAKRDLGLVRYIVEMEKVSRCEILELRKWRGLLIQDSQNLGDDCARNALLFAMESGKADVVEYLLQDWQIHPSTQTFGGQFDSRKYFKQTLEQRPSHFSSLSYEDQAVWYFRKRYAGLEVTAEDLEPMGENEMDRLEGDEDFLMSLVRTEDQGALFNAIWELYGHCRSLFLAMVNDAEAISLHYFLPLRHSSQINTQKRQILQTWCESRDFRLRMAAGTLSIIQNDWDQFVEAWNAAEGFDWTLTTDSEAPYDYYPFSLGMRHFAADMYRRALRQEVIQARNFMLSLTQNPHHPRPRANPEDRVGGNHSEICLLLAAAGSGKSHRMFNLLEQQFGFYLISGAVGGQNLSSDAGELYRPRTSTIPGDTELLFRTIEHGWKRRPSAHDYHSFLAHHLHSTQLVFEVRCRILLENRVGFFYEVMEVYPQLEPWQWLEYQLSYDRDIHPLRRLFHCLLLLKDIRAFASHDKRFRWRDVETNGFQQKYRFLWCFDEVQCDVVSVETSNQAAASVSDAYGGTVLSSLVTSFSNLEGSKCLVLGGTALNLEAVRNAARAGMLTAGQEYRDRFLDRCRLVRENVQFDSLLRPAIRSVLDVVWETTAPEISEWNLTALRGKLGASLVGNKSMFEDSSFISLFHTRRKPGGFLADLNVQQALDKIVSDFQSGETWTHIQNQSLPLRGRHRWSVCFVEELLRIYITDGSLSESQVLGASVTVQRNAKEPLKRRIGALAVSEDSRSRKVADDIFHMAMQAELFGRSRILDSAQAEILVEQALGYVQEANDKKVKVSLSEWLVIDAVMEYRRSISPNHSLIDHHIASWQYNASSFGFITEDRLAEAIYAGTHEDQQMALRKSFLSNFDSVFMMSEQGCDEDFQLDLNEYVLEHYPRPWAIEVDEAIHIGPWLHKVLNDVPRAPFLLPSNFAGPDVMFVLRRTVGTQVKRLVCGIQCKVVENLVIDGSVMNTIDPDRWYCNSKGLRLRKTFFEELSSFKDEIQRASKDIKFFTILFAARDEGVDYKKPLTELTSRKADPDFSNDLVTRAKAILRSLQRRKTKASRKSIQMAKDDIISAEALKGALTSTKYYLKIIANDSVEAIFGPVFYRILQAMKK